MNFAYPAPSGSPLETYFERGISQQVTPRLTSRCFLFCLLISFVFVVLGSAATGERAPGCLARAGETRDAVPLGLDGESPPISQERKVRDTARSTGSDAHGKLVGALSFVFFFCLIFWVMVTESEE